MEAKLTKIEWSREWVEMTLFVSLFIGSVVRKATAHWHECHMTLNTIPSVVCLHQLGQGTWVLRSQRYWATRWCSLSK